MTNQQHPITPPPELVEQWIGEIWHEGTPVRVAQSDLHLAARAAQWGADAELEACCEWVCLETTAFAADLKAARRPKPPSLKEQALAVIENSEICDHLSPEHAAILRRALEALDG